MVVESNDGYMVSILMEEIKLMWEIYIYIYIYERFETDMIYDIYGYGMK